MQRMVLWQLKKWLKIGFGLLVFLAGIVMLATPGQGVLCMLVGFKLLRKEVPWIHSSWLWIRRHLPTSWVARGDILHDLAYRWAARWITRKKAWIRSRRRRRGKNSTLSSGAVAEGDDGAAHGDAGQPEPEQPAEDREGRCEAKN